MKVNKPVVLPSYPPRRTVVRAEACAWMAAHPAAPGVSVVTSLPDVSEVPQFGFERWKPWFIATARQVIEWVPADGVAIFYQSDIRHRGVWLDKGFLVQLAAMDAGAAQIWHKIVCRKPPGAIGQGRPTYSHMLCFSRQPRPEMLRPGPDVLADAGPMSWNRGMGEAACHVACRFVRNETPSTTIVDPFCGEGTLLAVANELGFDAIGVDLSPKRCRAAVNASLARENTSKRGR